MCFFPLQCEMTRDLCILTSLSQHARHAITPALRMKSVSFGKSLMRASTGIWAFFFLFLVEPDPRACNSRPSDAADDAAASRREVLETHWRSLSTVCSVAGTSVERFAAIPSTRFSRAALPRSAALSRARFFEAVAAAPSQLSKLDRTGAGMLVDVLSALPPPAAPWAAELAAVREAAAEAAGVASLGCWALLLPPPLEGARHRPAGAGADCCSGCCRRCRCCGGWRISQSGPESS